MSPRTYLSIAEQLHRAEVAFDNTIRDKTIIDATSKYGYGPEKIAEGQGIYTEALALQQAQTAAYGDQYEATHNLKTAWKRANSYFSKTYRIARIAFRGNKKAELALMLKGGVKRDYGGWIEQATVFYSNLIEEGKFLAVMENYSFDRAHLLEEKALVDEVEKANSRQELAKGQAIEATHTRDSKLDELNNWYKDFIGIAEIALEESPQYLEALGIIVP
jgi:hypothetical protein